MADLVVVRLGLSRGNQLYPVCLFGEYTRGLSAIDQLVVRHGDAALADALKWVNASRWF